MFQWIDVTHVLAAYHEGKKTENPHCHIILKMASVLQKQSFDVRIKKLFEIVKRADYSTKDWDGNLGFGAGSYLFSDPASEIIACKGFTEEDVKVCSDAHEAFKEVNEVNKERASTKLIDKALVEFEGSDWNPDTLQRQVFTYMLKCIKDNENYHPNDFNLKRYTQEVCVRLCPTDKFNDFADRYYWRIFPND